MQNTIESRLEFRTIALAVALPAALMLVGAGCMRLGDDAAKNAIAPIQVPVEAYEDAAKDIDAVGAKQNEENDRASDDLTIAMVHSDAASQTMAGPGVIGCGDRMAYIKRHREAETDSVLSDVLTTLFSVKDSTVDGLHNSLWESSLSVDKIQSRDGVTTEVWLKGKMVSAGACATPRVKAQIEYTIKRIKPNFKVFLNGTEAEYRCFGDMSGECK